MPPLRRLLDSVLNDPRDIVFLRLSAAASLMIPAAALLYVWFQIWLAALYLLVWGFVFLDRFILMLHCTSHRALFRPRFRLFNHFIPWVLGPVFGETPNTYFAHHLGMHHREENLPNDTSTTLRYRRDSLLHWLRYVGRFLVIGLPELCVYFVRKRNYKLLRRVLLGEGCYWLAVAGLMLLSWKATLVVFVFPVALVRVLMMAGNWGQHAFVDPSAPADAFRNSITCLHARYNRRCFNDGYHIIHHLEPRQHYTEMPGEFERNRERYGREDAIVFEGLDFFGVWLCLMLGRWKRLARAFVRLPGAPPRTDDDVIAFLRSRVRPLPAA